MKRKTIFNFFIFLAIIFFAFVFISNKEQVINENEPTPLPEERVIHDTEKDKQVSLLDKEKNISTTTKDEDTALEEVEEDEAGVDIIIEDEELEIIEEESPKGPSVPIGSQTFVAYTNRAIGYTIDRPDRWYWQHFNSSELAGKVPQVIDYFIADRNPLIGFNSEYLGEIVIEVTKKDLKEFAGGLKGFSKKSVTVGEEFASRYEGVRFGDTIIEYHFTKGNFTFRIIYTRGESTVEEEAIFETVVSSFSFN